MKLYLNSVINKFSDIFKDNKVTINILKDK